MSEETEITLYDVELMIGVLEKFVRLSRKASRVLKALAPKSGSGQGDFMQQFMGMALQNKMQGLQLGDAEADDEPLDEETKKLIAKVRAKQSAKV